MRAISERICTRSLASRFDSGSSIRNACGWRTMARPMATRWRWPPESALGLRLEQLVEAEDARPRRAPASSISCLRHLLQLEPERHVVEHAHVRVERVVLEHHGDVAVLRRHVVDDAVADADRPLRDRLEPGDHPQRGRLAAARRADEHHELPVGDVEVERAHRLGAVGVDLPDVVEHDVSHRRPPMRSVGAWHVRWLGAVVDRGRRARAAARARRRRRCSCVLRARRAAARRRCRRSRTAAGARS